MGWGSIIGAIAGPILGGIIGGDASRDAADAQAGASQAAIDEQRRVTNMLLRMQDPSRQLGYGAQGDLATLYGYSLPAFQSANQLIGGQGQGQGQGFNLPGAPGAFGGMWGNLQNQMMQRGGAGAGAGAAPTDPSLQGRAAGAPGNMSRFFASPDYNFRRDEGMRGIEQSAAARGGAFSGNALRGLSDFNSNLAAGEYGNYFNRLMAMAGMGQAATNQAGGYAQQGSQNVSNLLQSQGDARASGIMGGANSLAGGINSGINNFILGRGLGVF